MIVGVQGVVFFCQADQKSAHADAKMQKAIAMHDAAKAARLDPIRFSLSGFRPGE